MGTNQHVTNKNNEWRVIRENNKKATKLFLLKRKQLNVEEKLQLIKSQN